jgi:hypothetical protein
LIKLQIPSLVNISRAEFGFWAKAEQRQKIETGHGQRKPEKASPAKSK